jgi:hypothetical protein
LIANITSMETQAFLCETSILINNSQTAVTYQFNSQYTRGNTM